MRAKNTKTVWLIYFLSMAQVAYGDDITEVVDETADVVVKPFEKTPPANGADSATVESPKHQFRANTKLGLLFDQFTFAGVDGSTSVSRQVGRMIQASGYWTPAAMSTTFFFNFLNTGTTFGSLPSTSPNSILVSRYYFDIGAQIKPWSTGVLKDIALNLGYGSWIRVAGATSADLVHSATLIGPSFGAQTEVPIFGKLGVFGKAHLFLPHSFSESGSKSGYFAFSIHGNISLLARYHLLPWLSVGAGFFAAVETIQFSGKVDRRITNGLDSSIPFGFPIEIEAKF